MINAFVHPIIVALKYISPFKNIIISGSMGIVNLNAILSNEDRENMDNYNNDPNFFQKSLKEKSLISRAMSYISDILTSESLFRPLTITLAVYTAFFSGIVLSPYIAGFYIAAVVFSVVTDYVIDMIKLRETRIDYQNKKISQDVVELYNLKKFIKRKLFLEKKDETYNEKEENEAKNPELKEKITERRKNFPQKIKDFAKKFLKKGRISMTFFLLSKFLLGLAMILPMIFSPTILLNPIGTAELITESVKNLLIVIRTKLFASGMQETHNQNNIELIRNLSSGSGYKDFYEKYCDIIANNENLLQKREKTYGKLNKNLRKIRYSMINEIEELIRKNPQISLLDYKPERVSDVDGVFTEVLNKELGIKIDNKKEIELGTLENLRRNSLRSEARDVASILHDMKEKKYSNPTGSYVTDVLFAKESTRYKNLFKGRES